MMKTRPRSPVAGVGSIERDEWDFSGVPDSELAGCCYWEYARESAFIRETLREYREWFLAGGLLNKAADALFKKMDAIQSIGDVSQVLVRGCSFKPGIVWQSVDDEAENYRHREAPPITGSFPAPWQELDPKERAYRARLANYPETIIPMPVERGDGYEAEDIARYYRTKHDRMMDAWREVQRQNPGKSEVQLREEGKLAPYEEIQPSLFWESGREVTVLRIAWANYTNDELAGAFRKWLKENRPEKFPVPSNKGRKPGDVRAHLTRLAVMRLLSRFKGADIFNPRNPAGIEILETSPFTGRKWLDSTKWHDARREARQLFHKLFPFLPAKEKPLSWERKPPGK
jgi:hypothetical protein